MVKRGMRMASVAYALFLSAVGLWLGGCKTTGEGLESEALVPAEYQETQADLDRRIASGELDVELIAEGEGVFVMPDFDCEGAVFVIDTSGSMRDHSTNHLRRDVLERLAAFLFSLPRASQVAAIDAEGRMIAMWQASGLETKKGMPRSAIAAFVDGLALYALNSDSNWNEGLAKAYALIAEDFKGLDTEIFIMGDEYYMYEFWTEFAKLERVEAVPVSVVRAHEMLLFQKPRVVPRSSKMFETYGRYLAGLTGGRFYTFAPPKYRRDWKTVVLARLVAERPGEVWEMDLDPAERTSLNRLLGEQFGEERDFLVGDGDVASSEASRIKVSISEEKIRRGEVRCYIERSWIDGSKAEEFRATLRKEGSIWEIQDWERLWEDEAK